MVINPTPRPTTNIHTRARAYLGGGGTQERPAKGDQDRGDDDPGMDRGVEVERAERNGQGAGLKVELEEGNKGLVPLEPKNSPGVCAGTGASKGD